MRLPARALLGVGGALLLTAGLSVSTPLTAYGSDAYSAERASYVVMLADTAADPAAVARDNVARLGGTVGYVYNHAIKGFSAKLSPAAAAALRRAPNVRSVEPDKTMTAFAQTVSSGVKRIAALQNPDLDIDGVDDQRVDVDIAILDTGIDFDHPDLNVVSRTSCVLGSCQNNTGDDGNGHGTHVAGIAAAIDNSIGVVGVAPGARLHAVKVLNDAGSGSLSGIVAGIDWVVARASTIEVINMSLGCDGCYDAAMSTAITNAVNAGIVVVVAAGNSDADASSFFPANHPDVITVSALADSDGRPGGTGGVPSCRTDQDDTLADFSNWGATIDLAAPGVCIYSTWKGGGYETLSGTSMASPHVAGAAAYYASLHNPAGRSDVMKIRDDLIAAGSLNWTDDSGDGYKEPVLDVGTPPVPGAPRASFTYTCSGKTCGFDASTSTDPDGSIASYTWDFGDGTTGTGTNISHTYAVNDKVYTVTLTVTDNDGKKDDSDQQVIVGNPPPVAAFSASCTSPRVCTFDGGASYDPGGSIASWAWSFGDGTTGTGQSVSHTYPAPGGGTHTIKLTVTDDRGKTASISKTVTAPPNQLPEPVIHESSCNGDNHSCFLDASRTTDPDGGLTTQFTYLWDFGDGTTGTGMIQNHRFPATGSYTVKLTVTDDELTSATTTLTVVLPNTTPIPVITVSSCNATWHTCYLDGYATRDPDGGYVTGFSYQWDFGDGTTGTGITQNHRFPAAGTYTVRLTVTDDENTKASTTKTVTVP